MHTVAIAVLSIEVDPSVVYWLEVWDVLVQEWHGHELLMAVGVDLNFFWAGVQIKMSQCRD